MSDAHDAYYRKKEERANQIRSDATDPERGQDASFGVLLFLEFIALQLIDMEKQLDNIEQHVRRPW